MNAKRIRTFILGGLLFASGTAFAEGPALSPAAAAFQQSYDDEATGKTAEALAALDRLPEPQRSGYVAQLRRGWLLYRLGQNEAAVAAYERASAAVPASIEARLGALPPLMALRRWVTADKAARDVLRADPGNYLANLRLAWVHYNQGDFSSALALYRKLEKAYPSDVDVKNGVGWSLLKVGRAAEAAAAFRELLEIAPKNALARDGLAATGALTASR